MYRLQIHLKTTDGGPISKFLHLTKGDITIKQLLYDASDRVQAVYPGNPPLNITRVQDARACDLDPSFLVNQVLSDFDEVHLFVTNKFKSAFKRVLNPVSSPNKKKKQGVETPTNISSPTLHNESGIIQETPTPAARKSNPSNGTKTEKTPRGAASAGSAAATKTAKATSTPAAKKAKIADTPKSSQEPKKEPKKQTPKPAPPKQNDTPAKVIESPIKGELTTAQRLLGSQPESSSVSMPPPVMGVIEETPEKEAVPVTISSAATDKKNKAIKPTINPVTKATGRATPQPQKEQQVPSSQSETQVNESDSTDKNEGKESDQDEDDTTATESSEDESSVPIKAVEMPKSALAKRNQQKAQSKQPVKPSDTPRPASQPQPSGPAKPSDTPRPASQPQPSGPAAPSPKPARAGRNSLSKLESLPSIDVHDGKKKQVQQKKESSDEELSADGSSSSDSDGTTDSDSDSDDDNNTQKKPRRSTLLASMIGKK